MRLVRRIVVGVVLVLGLVFTRPTSSTPPSSGRVGRFASPNAVFEVLSFGALRPVLRERLWAMANEAEAEGRVWDLAEAFDALIQLDPRNPRLRWFLGYTLSFDLAQSEVDDATRWRLYRRALRTMDDAITAHPGQYILAELRFRMLFQLIADDPWCARQFRQSHRVTAFEAALEAAIDLKSRFPDRETAWSCYRQAAEETIDWLMNRNRFVAAASCYESLIELEHEAASRFPDGGFSQDAAGLATWPGRLRRLAKVADWWEPGQDPRVPAVDGAALIQLLNEIARDMQEGVYLLGPERETPDGAAIHLIIIRSIQLAQSEALRQFPLAALPWLEPLRRICALAEGRLGPRMPYYSVGYVTELEEFLELDATLLTMVQSGQEATAEQQRHWHELLEELDRRLRDPQRAGRSDQFQRRLARARRP